MKHVLSYTLLFLIACSSNTQQEPNTSKEVNFPIFQEILDAAQVKGAILLFDPQENTFYSNDFDWAHTGRLPASTFKIPNSIIALETGVVESDSTLFEWDGESRALKIWEQDLMFRDALRLSCVPCYQDVARRIGVDRMRHWLQKLDYPGMVIDSTNIDQFWLVGDSKISQFQQIEFLKRLHHSDLPIEKRTEQMLKRMLILEETNEYILRGKTGWAVRDGHNNGWLVGYLQRGEKIYFIACNIDPKESFNMDLFAKIRKEITLEAFRKMNLI